MKWIALITITLFLYSCGKEEVKETSKVKNETILPSALFVDKNIDGAVSVKEARKLKAGDKVKVHGKVMGASNPFIESRAMFVLGDPSSLTSCDLKPGDECKTPWDVCCDEDKEIAAGTLSIQVVDASGKAMKTGLEGKSGLQKLSKVVIQGVVASNSSAEAMTINAEQIFISK